MRKLPYYHSFSHKSHPSAIALAERLVKMAPGKMSKAHFTSSGSEANDLAIKMIWYYNNALGRPEKKKIISRQRAYHGVSIASGSLTGLPAFHRDFDLPLPMIRHVSCPHYWRFAAPGESEEAFASRLAAELEEKILAEGPETVAAFFGEPLMGAGGVITPPRTYWEKIQAVCRRHDVLVVADEVITGFGRTGRMFGSETYGIAPDILVLSKAITSSYMPLSALVFTDAIYQALAEQFGQDRRVRAWLHRERPSRRHRRRDGESQHHRGARSRRQRGRPRPAIPGAPAGLRGASLRRRSARHRPDRRAGARRGQGEQGGCSRSRARSARGSPNWPRRKGLSSARSATSSPFVRR